MSLTEPTSIRSPSRASISGELDTALASATDSSWSGGLPCAAIPLSNSSTCGSSGIAGLLGFDRWWSSSQTFELELNHGTAVDVGEDSYGSPAAPCRLV